MVDPELRLDETLSFLPTRRYSEAYKAYSLMETASFSIGGMDRWVDRSNIRRQQISCPPVIYDITGDGDSWAACKAHEERVAESTRFSSACAPCHRYGRIAS